PRRPVLPGREGTGHAAPVRRHGGAGGDPPRQAVRSRGPPRGVPRPRRAVPPADARRAVGRDALGLTAETESGGPGPGPARGPPGRIINRGHKVGRRSDRLEADLANPGTLGDSARLTKVMKERSSLERIVSVYREFKTVRADLAEAERMLASSDPDERALGKEELPALKERRDSLEADLKLLRSPNDPNDEKNRILDNPAGAG